MCVQVCVSIVEDLTVLLKYVCQSYDISIRTVWTTVAMTPRSANQKPKHA